MEVVGLGVVVLVVDVALGAGALRERFERRVSWTPGAEGAPMAGWVVVAGVVVGTMRRDWW